MKKHYPWLWFDLDGTLFDFNKAEATALHKAFEILDLHFEPAYLPAYQRINHGLWQALERGEITQSALQSRRFELLLAELGLGASAARLGEVFVEQLSLCPDLIDGAFEVLSALSLTSRIAILTNGLKSVQRRRIGHSFVREYISAIVISEEIGAAKPQREFFAIASKMTGLPATKEILLIGDGLGPDIRGGAAYGLDTCWFNPRGEPRPGDVRITYEIRGLPVLLDLID